MDNFNQKSVTLVSYLNKRNWRFVKRITNRLIINIINKMIVSGLLIQQKEVVAINTIRKYMAEIDIKSSNTFHEFETNLPAYIQNHINVIKMGTINKRLSSIYMNHESSPITEMNELYISAIGGDGSDKVFETEHVDGPFFFLPFCNV